MNTNTQLVTWINALGTWAASPVTGAHHGPFTDRAEAELAMDVQVRYEPECPQHAPTGRPYAPHGKPVTRLA